MAIFKPVITDGISEIIPPILIEAQNDKDAIIKTDDWLENLDESEKIYFLTDCLKDCHIGFYVKEVIPNKLGVIVL